MLAQSVSTLIGHIYAGVHDPAAWRHALDGLIAQTGSRFAMMSSVDLRHREFSKLTFHGADDARFLDGARDYAEGVYADDPALIHANRNPHDRFISLHQAERGRDFVPGGYVPWVRDAFGSADYTVGYTAPDGELSLGLSIHAATDRGSHSAGDLKLFRLLFDHFERAMRLAARPPDLVAGAEATLLIDRRGGVAMANAAAEAVIADADGLAITAGRLTGARAIDSARIDAAIASALAAISDGGAGGALAVPRPSGRRPWLLKVTPLPNPPSPFEAFRPAALIRIVDPQAAPGDAAARLWTAAFALTPAEARLAQALLAHEGNLREAADRIGIAHATARVHLASLFRKTGVRSQPDLARLLTRLEG